MALDPDMRPRTALDLADAVAHVSAGGTEAATANGWPARLVVPLAGMVFAVTAAATWLFLR
jgi:hypothetical protein